MVPNDKKIMMNKQVYLIFSIVLIFISCKKDVKSTVVIDETKDIVDSIKIANKEYKDLIQNSLYVKNAERYFILLDSSQMQKFVIVRNDSLKIDENLGLTKFGRKIPIVEYDSIKKNKELFYLDFRDVVISKDTTTVSYHFNYENFITESYFKKNKNGKWEEIYTLLHKF